MSCLVNALEVAAGDLTLDVSHSQAVLVVKLGWACLHDEPLADVPTHET